MQVKCQCLYQNVYINISVLTCDRDCHRVIICITPLDFALPSIQPDFGGNIGSRGPTGLGGGAGGGGGYPGNNGARKEVDMDLDSDEDNGELGSGKKKIKKI